MERKHLLKVCVVYGFWITYKLLVNGKMHKEDCIRLAAWHHQCKRSRILRPWNGQVEPFLIFWQAAWILEFRLRRFLSSTISITQPSLLFDDIYVVSTNSGWIRGNINHVSRCSTRPLIQVTPYVPKPFLKSGAKPTLVAETNAWALLRNVFWIPRYPQIQHWSC